MLTMKRNQLMIEQYRRIRMARSDQIEVEMKDYVPIIEGSDLVLQAMTKDEVLLQGDLQCVRVAADEKSTGR